MHRARVVVLIVALACVCFLCQASEESSRRQRGLLALLKVASRITRQYSPNSRPYEQQEEFTQTRNLGYPALLQVINPNQRYVLQRDTKGAPTERQIEGKPPEEPMGDSEESSEPIEELNSRPIVWAKKSGEETVMDGLKQVSSSIAGNFIRASRSTVRPYDVPQIECPPAEDQMERFPCPSPDKMGRYRCIDDHVLCDGFIDCPDAQDEDRQHCMFYKTTKAHMDIMADAIIKFIRSPYRP